MADEDQPISPYLASLRSNPPASKKPVLINTENPLNQAKAYPALHVGIDAKRTPEKTKFPIKLTKHDSLDSSSLVAAALKPAPGKSVDGGRTPGTPAQAHNLSRINLAPGREERFRQIQDDKPSTSKRKNLSTGRKPNTPKSGLGSAEIGSDTALKSTSMKANRRTSSVKPVNPQAGSMANDQKGKLIPTLRLRPPLHPPRPTTVRRPWPTEEPPLKPNGQIDWHSRPLSKNLAEAAHCDKMLIGWHAAGIGFEAFPGDTESIKEEWDRLTGQTEANEMDLSRRHMLIQESIADNGDYDKMLIRYVRIQKLKPWPPELWERVSRQFQEDDNILILPIAARMRWHHIVKQPGFDDKNFNLEWEEGDKAPRHLDLHCEFLGKVSYPDWKPLPERDADVETDEEERAKRERWRTLPRWFGPPPGDRDSPVEDPSGVVRVRPVLDDAAYAAIELKRITVMQKWWDAHGDLDEDDDDDMDEHVDMAGHEDLGDDADDEAESWTNKKRSGKKRATTVVEKPTQKSTGKEHVRESPEIPNVVNDYFEGLSALLESTEKHRAKSETQDVEYEETASVLDESAGGTQDEPGIEDIDYEEDFSVLEESAGATPEEFEVEDVDYEETPVASKKRAGKKRARESSDESDIKDIDFEETPLASEKRAGKKRARESPEESEIEDVEYEETPRALRKRAGTKRTKRMKQVVDEDGAGEEDDEAVLDPRLRTSQSGKDKGNDDPLARRF